MSFSDDLAQEATTPSLNGTAVWLDGQSADIQRAFMAWVNAGKSKAALFRTCRKHGLEHITSVSTFREHCREILESGQFEQA